MHGVRGTSPALSFTSPYAGPHLSHVLFSAVFKFIASTSSPARTLPSPSLTRLITHNSDSIKVSLKSDLGPFLEVFISPWRESIVLDSRSGPFSIGCSSIISSGSSPNTSVSGRPMATSGRSSRTSWGSRRRRASWQRSP